MGTSSQSFSGCFLNASETVNRGGMTWNIPRLLPGLYQPDEQAIGHMGVTEILSPLASIPASVLSYTRFLFSSSLLPTHFHFPSRMYSLVTSFFIVCFLCSLCHRLPNKPLADLCALSLSLSSFSYFLVFPLLLLPPSLWNTSRAMTSPDHRWRV